MIGVAGGDLGGYAYGPYGEERDFSSGSIATGNPLRYIGEHMDADGTYKFGARYYDPSQGRFTQMDPSGQEANPYAYATCNPINAKDPSGLLSCGQYTAILTLLDIGIFGAAAIIGALSGGWGLAMVGVALATLGWSIAPSAALLAIFTLTGQC